MTGASDDEVESRYQPRQEIDPYSLGMVLYNTILYHTNMHTGKKGSVKEAPLPLSVPTVPLSLPMSPNDFPDLIEGVYRV